MKILFLGGQDLSLFQWLQKQEDEVFFYADRILPSILDQQQPDMIVSYGYRHILPTRILSFPPYGTVNLHISFLPWNRGADPNPWSHLENTPKGVSIHEMDAGIDTGNILVQKKVSFEHNATLQSSYEKLQSEIQDLFRENWKKLKTKAIHPTPQIQGGSFHQTSDRIRFLDCMGEQGWQISIEEFIQRYREKNRRFSYNH